MHSLFWFSLLPYAAAVPLGNVYNALFHLRERDPSPASGFIFPTGSYVPTATDTFAPIPTGTSAPIGTGTVTGTPLQTPQFPCAIKIDYGLAPRAAVPFLPNASPDSDHNIMNILPRQGGGPGLPGTGFPFPGATGFPRPPNGSPCFPSAIPSGRPSGRPSGTGSFPIPTGAIPTSTGTPSFEFPDDEPALPEPSGQLPSS